MEENTRSQQIPSRGGLRNCTGGDIGEVQGCHIIRSTGRKDRHSKVCTSKGPKDRRVRLAAHTAIQFYDVQDRLGHDRPSKAMDWLIQKAKSAIDDLEQLPAAAWNPTKFSAENAIFEQEQAWVVDPSTAGSSSKRPMTMLENEYRLQVLNQSSNADPNASFLPPSLDSNSTADAIKSCFPIGISRTRSQSQDLRLSLQSFQDPLMDHQPQPPHHKNHTHNTEEAYSQHQVPLNGTTLLGFDGGYGGWSEHHQHQPTEISRFQGQAPWNIGGDLSGGNGGAAGYLFSSQPPPQQLLGQSQFFSHGGPLQSSNKPSIRPWMDPSTIPNTTADNSHQHHHRRHHHHHNPAAVPIYSSSISGVEFTSTVVGFSGFHIPARIQGNKEEHAGYTYEPSSASSDSHH